MLSGRAAGVLRALVVLVAVYKCVLGRAVINWFIPAQENERIYGEREKGS